MISVKEKIATELSKVVSDIAGEEIHIELDFPASEDHGDYSSNIAMIVFSRVKREGGRGKWKNPKELAEEITSRFTLHPSPFIDKVEVAPPGFINFWVSHKNLSDRLSQLLSGVKEVDGTGKKDNDQDIILRAKRSKVEKFSTRSNSKIVLEFTDPNPFKQFHIGHLRNLILGESYARLLEAQGNTVWRVNYQGDVGLHVAKALYGIKKHESRIKELEHSSIAEKTKFLGESYAFGSEKYETDPEAKKEIVAINKAVYNKDPEIMQLYTLGRDWSLEGFEEIYKRVGTKFEKYYFESQTTEPGLKIVKKGLTEGVFEESDGAIVYKGEKAGLHTRVFITREGYPTYEGKDMALPEMKYKDFPYDQSIILTAHEQGSYFKVLLAAVGQMFPELGKKTTHYSFGFVTLKEGKMSSRSGNIITGMWLLDEAKRQITESFPDMDKETADKVAIGAVKYSMLKVTPVSDIAFSFKESITLEGNSGPYLQYTYARTRSVLAKGTQETKETRSPGRPETKVKSTSVSSGSFAPSVSFVPEELSILRWLFRFDEIVEQAASGFAPNLIANYLYELAQKFNLFYQKHKIIGNEQEEFRLAITAGVGKVLKEGLYLLGIEAPERM